jgi:hypothetical protein
LSIEIRQALRQNLANYFQGGRQRKVLFN